MSIPTYSTFGLGTFPSYPDAQVALIQLQDAAFSIRQLSFLAHSSALYSDWLSASANGRHSPTPSAKVMPSGRALYAGLEGLVTHPEEIVLATKGRIVAGGPLGAVLLSSSAFGGVVRDALQVFQLPEGAARMYCDRLNQGDFLVGVECAKRDIHRAEAILQNCRIKHWQIYDLTAVGTQQAATSAEPRIKSRNLYSRTDSAAIAPDTSQCCFARPGLAKV